MKSRTSLLCIGSNDGIGDGTGDGIGDGIGGWFYREC